MIGQPMLDLPAVDRRVVLRRYLALVPAACCVGLSLALAWFEYGSVAASDWLPYAVFAALLLAAALLSGAAMRPSRVAVLSLVGLLGLAAWNAISAAWSPVPSLARDEALLVAFYAVVFTIGVTTLRSPGVRRAAVALVAVGGALLALGVAAHLLLDSGPQDLVWAGRLGDPIQYPNALAALFLIAFWPAIALAAHPVAHVALRATALGGATAVLAAWLATQSKGGGIALALSGVVFFAVVRARLRALLPVAISATLVGAAYEPLTASFRAAPGDLSAAIRDMGTAILVLAAAGTIIGVLYALLDNRLTVPERTRRRLGSLVAALLVTAVGAAIAGFFVKVDDPPQFFADKWEAFKADAPEQGSSHLVNIGSHRYDTWRVGLREFLDHPVEGTGARGFAASYLRHGKTGETPLRAHSLEVDVLGETGVVGFVLLALAVVAPLTRLARRARVSLAWAAVLAACVYWITHASGDWIWTFPAAGVPFFLLLGAGVADDEQPLLRPRLAAPAAVVAAAVALVGFAPPWLSSRFTERAFATRSPDDLRWARRLDPLSVEPFLAQAELATPPADIVALRRAVNLEPRRAELHLSLALALRRAGREREAMRELRTAVRLSPSDPFVLAELRRR